MKNERLEKNREILKQYKDIELFIGNHEELKYRWYLKLKDILEGYLGIHNRWYSSPEDFRNFPVSFYRDSHNCTEQEAIESINETADFLVSLKTEVDELNNSIKLNQYELSSLYRSIRFDVPSYYDSYKDLELVSITFKKDSGISYNVKESDSYDWKWEFKDEVQYYKHVEGKFLKEDIRFNITKEYIESLEILDNDELKSLTVSQFAKKYKDLNGFLYKELKDLTLTSDHYLVTQAIDLISKFINVRALPPIRFVEKLPSSSRTAIGTFYFGIVDVDMKPTYTPKLKILIHELGHYIHEQYFHNKQFRFSTKGKSNYAGKNCRENFAECFTELIYSREDTERTRKMIKILEEII